MGFIGDWRASRERRRRAERYLRETLSPPESSDIGWLAALTGDRELAERELAFARRAIGLIVAERDALDDRTASDVAHALSPIIDAEARRSATVGSQWLLRRKGYSLAMAARGHAEDPATRFGRVLLEGAGITVPTADAVTRAAQIVQSTRTMANDALRAVFGVASMPEDVRPSAIRP